MNCLRNSCRELYYESSFGLTAQLFLRNILLIFRKCFCHLVGIKRKGLHSMIQSCLWVTQSHNGKNTIIGRQEKELLDDKPLKPPSVVSKRRLSKGLTETQQRVIMLRAKTFSLWYVYTNDLSALPQKSFAINTILSLITRRRMSSALAKLKLNIQRV